MCGRYNLDENTIERIRESLLKSDILRKHGLNEDKFWEMPGAGGIIGDICPSQKAFVLTGRGPHLTWEQMKWGFPQKDGKGLLINARAETALERVTFRESILFRRCVIPARQYYEWNRAREKVTFQRKESNEPVLYMAGCYKRFGEEECFVILTTQANASVLTVHDRMPLILEEDDVEKWVYDDGFVHYILQKTHCMLRKYQEYEQQEMFWA